MARQTKRVTIDSNGGRDSGKTFEITEMAVDAGERWANRALLALINASAKLPEGIVEKGLAGLDISWRSMILTGMVALQGLQAETVQPLLDELKRCIRFVPALPNAPAQDIFPGENSQIEEIRTWYTLYLAAVELHVGFSLAGALSTTESNVPQAVPAS